MIQNKSIYKAISDANNSEATDNLMIILARIDAGMLREARAGRTSYTVHLREHFGNYTESQALSLVESIKANLDGKGFNLIPTGDNTSLVISWA